MRVKITFIEKKGGAGSSIGLVFRQVAKSLPDDVYQKEFRELNFGVGFLDILKNLFLYKKNESDIYHITGNVHYLTLRHNPENTVLTIHDLVFLHLRKGFRKFVLRKLFLDMPLKRLKYLTTISEAVKKEIIRETGFPAERIRVIENPLQEIYLENNSFIEFNSDCPVILQIGTAPNKNLKNLIEAVSDINCRLKIIGKISPEIENLLAEKKIKFQALFDLNQNEMKREYAQADIVAFCSTYEGFGLPIIEAQAMSTPVITSDRSPMKEVSGGAAFLADPDDPRSIADGLRKIIVDEIFRNDLVKRGKSNVARFRSEKTARLYAGLYEEILRNRK